MAAHLDAGRDVVLLAEGDPLFYGSSMYLLDRFRDRFPVEVVPGVPAFAAATATVPAALVRQNDVLTVLPGTLPEPESGPPPRRHRRRGDHEGSAAPSPRSARRWSRPAGSTARSTSSAPHSPRSAGYRWPRWTRTRSPTSPWSWCPATPRGPRRRHGCAPVPRWRPRSPPRSRPSPSLLVVGLGPGPEGWLTPEASAALAEVSHVVGYAPYVNRVPQRPGLQRHASGNTVEVDRARFALDLALQGERVAVVSGGDAGVFGMAAAVFEAAADPAYADVPVRVLPGVSAIQAVAARAGAPIGADFAVMSLSDRLKPWAVVERRLRLIAEADLVLGVYNPASRSRREQVVEMQKILLEHRSPDTVVVVGRDVGRAEESLSVTTLGALDTDSIDMKCLLIVGASATRVEPGGTVWTPRWVD
nr:precorrin-3B C(17)-methyltransferase [Nocardioides convexus]